MFQLPHYCHQDQCSKLLVLHRATRAKGNSKVRIILLQVTPYQIEIAENYMLRIAYFSEGVAKICENCGWLHPVCEKCASYFKSVILEDGVKKFLNKKSKKLFEYVEKYTQHIGT